MYLSSKEAASAWMLIGAPWEEIMQGEKPCRRFYVQGCGGQPFIKIQKHISRCVMYVKEWESHHGGMKFV